MSLVQGGMFLPTLGQGQKSLGGVQEETFRDLPSKIGGFIVVDCIDPVCSDAKFRKRTKKLLGIKANLDRISGTIMTIPGGGLSLVRRGKFSTTSVDIQKHWIMIAQTLEVLEARTKNKAVVLVLGAHTPCLDGCENAVQYLSKAVQIATQKFPNVLVRGAIHHIGAEIAHRYPGHEEYPVTTI